MFGLLFTIDAALALLSLVAALMMVPLLAEITLQNIVVWTIQVAVFVGVLGGALGLRLKGRKTWANILLSVLAVPGIVLGVITLIFMAVGDGGPH